MINSLRFQNLSFRFGTDDPLFDRVDFDFPLGENVWIKAEQGEGRSTLLQLLAVLQMPTGGTYFINNDSIVEMSFEEFLPYRLKIAYGFDTGGLIHNRTLLENLTLPVLYHKLKPAKTAIDEAKELLHLFQIGKYADHRPSVVPGGTRKLVCLIRTLMTDPELLLLDDPTVGLGQDTSLKFFDLIEQKRKAGIIKHVYLSSFDDRMMSQIPHRVLHIFDGKLHDLNATEPKKVVSL